VPVVGDAAVITCSACKPNHQPEHISLSTVTRTNSDYPATGGGLESVFVSDSRQPSPWALNPIKLHIVFSFLRTRQTKSSISSKSSQWLSLYLPKLNPASELRDPNTLKFFVCAITGMFDLTSCSFQSCSFQS
jgi:hypothetical protein